jgi:hypothetical protein
MAAGVAVGSMTGQPAFASLDTFSYSRTVHSFGLFDAENQVLKIQDRAPDGHSSMVMLKVGSIAGNAIEYWNFHGSGTIAAASVRLTKGRVI